MAGSTTWCRPALAAATIAITALAVAACGAKNNTSGSSTNGGDSSLGSAPSSFSTPDTAAAGGAGSSGATPVTGGGGNGGASIAPTYPKDAKAYVQELLKAMAQPNYARISQLAVQSAVQQIKDSINGNGGNPNSQWPYLNCVTGTGPNQSTCVARNSHGDELTVKLNQPQLGFPTAVIEAPLSRTRYPATPTDYVNALLSAYEEGNQQRMVRLSNDTVKSKITCTFGKQIGSTPIDGTYSKVTVNGLGVDLGKKYEFKVLTNPGGKANAVKEVLSKQC
ncbi:MAG: hypothetical protein QOE61_3204 [Micromonosporaceae bacterium]|jgi:hypothetical protein|nr:hypothetical protein [Micromonosporaceae bacterium]